jgi:hypothetical protein
VFGLLMSCGQASAPAADALLDGSCVASVFPSTVDVSEASGAAVVIVRGAPRLVVLSDSGNQGAYAALDIDSGALVKTGKLPLGATSDDLEGAATINGDYIAATSAGWIYRWRFSDAVDEFVAVAPPYPLGPVDDSIPLDGGLGDVPPPTGSGYVCSAFGVNCGRNFESICLAPQPNAVLNACVGLVASKSDGNVYCLTLQNEKLRIDATRRFAVAVPGALADCSIDEQNRAWVGANLYARNRVFVLTGWDQLPVAPVVQQTDDASVGFAEGIWVRSGPGSSATVVRLSDTGSAGPSEMARFDCALP